MVTRMFVGSTVAISVALHPAVFAGDLNPPAGAVSPTGKTLTEVEPRIALSAENTPGDANSVFEITQPGSYYLTESLLVPPGFNGIEIETSRVTIDLNGFTIDGLSQTGATGITASQTKTRITVKNGFVTGCLNTGIGLGDDDEVVVEGVVVNGCGGNGMSVRNRSLVRDVIARDNDVDGIQVGAGSHVINSRSLSNGESGIEATDPDVLIDGCTIETNAGLGILALDADRVRVLNTSVDASGLGGIGLGDDSIVRDTIVSNSGSSGLFVGDRAVLERVIASDNGTSQIHSGISAGVGAILTSVVCDTNAGWGAMIGNDSKVHNSMFRENGTESISRGGVSGGNSVTLEGSSFLSNAGEGFALQTNAIVTKCMIEGNGNVGAGRDGCRFGAFSVIRGSTARFNGTVGSGGVRHSGFVGQGDNISFIDCVATGNTSEHGFFIAGRNATMRGCLAADNGRYGAFITSGTVVENTFSDNGEVGLYIAAGLVKDNYAANNGGNGILLYFESRAGFQNGARVMDNMILDNTNIGISSQVGGHTIVGNTASGNGTNYSFATGSRTGTVVVGTGNVSTNPWANFSY